MRPFDVSPSSAARLILCCLCLGGVGCSTQADCSTQPDAVDSAGDSFDSGVTGPGSPEESGCQHLCADMVYIPAGYFMMGCNEEIDKTCFSSERPQHMVYLSGYWIDRHEVTLLQFGEFLNAIGDPYDCGVSGLSGWHDDSCLTEGGFREAYIETLPADIGADGNTYAPGPGLSRMPIWMATWKGAARFCEWAGKRLCTEAEWEKAARGEDGRIYPWGNEKATCDKTVISEDGFWGCGLGESTIGCVKVDSPALANDVSPYGVVGMGGNADEWVADWFNPFYYAASPERNPMGPARAFNHLKFPFSTLCKVMKGGAYAQFAWSARLSSRKADGCTISIGSGSAGIRCCAR